MLYIRHYHCISCGKGFISTEGGFINKPSSRECPHCGSTKTIENPVKGATDAIKAIMK